jgi:hypothetical protein
MDWQPYIKASWEMVMDAEGRTQTHLGSELEAYLVQMMARNFRNKGMPPDIICLELAQARHATDFRNIGDSCLFVDAWRIKPARLVSKDYYLKMGQIAYGYAAHSSRPVNRLFEQLSREFSNLSRVLAEVKQLAA